MECIKLGQAEQPTPPRDIHPVRGATVDFIFRFSQVCCLCCPCPNVVFPWEVKKKFLKVHCSWSFSWWHVGYRYSVILLVLYIDIDNYREAITSNQDCSTFCKRRNITRKKNLFSLSIPVHDGLSCMCLIAVPLCLIWTIPSPSFLSSPRPLLPGPNEDAGKVSQIMSDKEGISSLPFSLFSFPPFTSSYCLRHPKTNIGCAAALCPTAALGPATPFELSSLPRRLHATSTGTKPESVKANLSLCHYQ